MNVSYIFNLQLANSFYFIVVICSVKYLEGILLKRMKMNGNKVMRDLDVDARDKDVVVICVYVYFY